MTLNRVNRFIRRQTTGLTPPTSHRIAITSNKPVKDDQTGFLCHPQGFPFEVHRKWFGKLTTDSSNEHIGLMFDSTEYYPPDALLELTIPVRERVERFAGRVVLVRNHEDHFEIGLWLDQGDDASRVRIVEQICHIETYLKIKKYREGPYNLDPERVASEWISKYASGVPALQDSGYRLS